MSVSDRRSSSGAPHVAALLTSHVRTSARADVGSLGGDASNVTIWGLSTGAQLVASLLVCPLAEGLFHRAMVQSCVDLTNVRELREPAHEVWQHLAAEAWGRSLAAELGCAHATDAAAELRALREVPIEAIVEKSWSKAATDMYEPCADRRAGLRTAKPRTSLETLLSGAHHRVPVMIGVTEHDGLGKMELECADRALNTAAVDEPDRVSSGPDAAPGGLADRRIVRPTRAWAGGRCSTT